MQITTKDDAATVVTFKTLSVFSDSKSTKAGRPIYDDHEVVEIRLAGNKQTVGAFPAHEICGWVDGPDGTRQAQTYAMKYNAQYLAYKNGDGQVLLGTPLEALSVLAPGKRLELKALNIYTVEALASLDGNNLKRLGMGGRELKDQAQSYLDNASEHRIEDRMSEVVTAQDAKIAELMAKIAELQGDPLDHDKNGKKGGTAPATANAAATVAEVLALAETAHFKTFRAAAAKLLGDKTPATKDEIIAALKAQEAPADDEASPFADFEDDDIRNWLKDAAPELDTASFDREQLLEAADEVNAELAKKNGN